LTRIANKPSLSDGREIISSEKLDADPSRVQMVLTYRLAATFGGDPV